MFLKNIIYTYILATAVALTFTSCSSISGFEEGRALGKSKNEIIVSGNWVSLPNLYTPNTGEGDDSPTHFIFPNIDFSYKHGVTNKLDIGGRITTNLNTGFFAKYQLKGDNMSKFALGTGVEVATILGLIYNIYIPINMTYYFNENIALNLAPRGNYQFGLGLIDSRPGWFKYDTSTTFLGGNLGLQFGKKTKYGIDMSYYTVGLNQTFFSIGVGAKFKFN